MDNLKQLLDAKKKKHKEKIQRLEHKYYAEKVKLQREFASKLAELRKTFHEVRESAAHLVIDADMSSRSGSGRQAR